MGTTLVAYAMRARGTAHDVQRPQMNTLLEGFMSSSVWTKALVTSCAITVALSAGACNRDDSAAVDRDTDRLEANADTASTANRGGHEGAPISLTGCLQRGGGLNNYILTQVNSPSESPVATSGSANNQSNEVQREQLRGAKHSYELDGEMDNARDLVGKQVRVTGTLAETSDLRSQNQNQNQNRENREGLDIEAGDLAKVDVQSITQVAENCGDAR
jgi:hypothetical protein